MFGKSHDEPEIDPIVVEMIEAFRTGRVIKQNLKRHGICELIVEYLNAPLAATWYNPEGRFRSLSYMGNEHVDGLRESERVLRAAKERSSVLFDEMVRDINARRAAAKKAAE